MLNVWFFPSPRDWGDPTFSLHNYPSGSSLIIFIESLQSIRQMGQTLSEPITTKHTQSCQNSFVKVGSSSMQGWRINMEDAHTHILSLPGEWILWVTETRQENKRLQLVIIGKWICHYWQIEVFVWPTWNMLELYINVVRVVCFVVGHFSREK